MPFIPKEEEESQPRYIYYSSESINISPNHKLSSLLSELFSTESLPSTTASKEECLNIITNSTDLCKGERDIYYSILMPDERNSIILRVNDHNLATSVVLFRYTTVPAFKRAYGYGDILYVEYLCSSTVQKGEGTFLLMLLKKLSYIIKSSGLPIIGIYLQITDSPRLTYFYVKNGFVPYNSQYYLWDINKGEVNVSRGRTADRKVNKKSARIRKPYRKKSKRTATKKIKRYK
jgi:hypothetical protein